MKSLLLVAVLFGCSSESSEPAVAVDSAAVDTGTAVVDSAPVDTREAATCTLTGPCLESFASMQREADRCFGHFGPGECGVFNGAMTTCKWTDGASFDVVPVDGGEPTVVYKSKDGMECFRRLGNGDVVYPGGATFKTSITGGKLTVTCSPADTFTCATVAACIACGIDLRVCCM